MGILEAFSRQDVQAQVLVTLTLVGLAPLIYCVYNVWFHPLSRYPGPLLWRAMRLPYMRAAWSGRVHLIVQELHRKYGEVVRIAPDELSFAMSAAWDDIYSNQGHPAFPKSQTWHGNPPGYDTSVFNALDIKDHARQRRAMDPGFTERAVLRQEPIVQRYADVFIQRLSERTAGSAQKSTTVNIMEWINFVAFDIIGDLAFGESFHCLEEVKYHDWMSFTFNTIKANYYVVTLRHYPLLFNFLMLLIPKSVMERQKAHWGFAGEKVDRRIASNADHPDIISLLERQNEKGRDGITLGEMHANAALFILAGSETTVTLLTGIMNHLLKDPGSMETLKKEIRGSFASLEDMNFTALKQLPYLNAVIKEALRMCNPTPYGLVRISPPQGGRVGGHWVAGNTYVTIHPLTLSFSEQLFYEPYVWHPERWLEDAQTNSSSPFYNDDRKCVKTFGHGLRACIGEPLAWAEMRLILSKLLHAFDIIKADTPRSEIIWEEQNVLGVLEKHPLDVTLVERAD
ncbi:cytochrome P450 [Lophiostoma macrostomum CBS 122681]|uniref:Cytochrome P450 n=1 Tax=Lophiostoma macrostomum CBS 122681 TaxID=1314788 RepID=A0A6A6T1P8_9PLEO|nr:cytochrome P450 [Lophiostoma macrostomum CBS 122681]